MDASKNIEAVVQLAAIDHIEYLAPNEDIEDKGAL